MINTTIAKFRNKAASCFDQVEKGESVRIYRNGKPSALLIKSEPRAEANAYWKDAKPILDLGGKSAVRMLIEERRKNR